MEDCQWRLLLLTRNVSVVLRLRLGSYIYKVRYVCTVHIWLLAQGLQALMELDISPQIFGQQ